MNKFLPQALVPVVLCGVLSVHYEEARAATIQPLSTLSFAGDVALTFDSNGDVIGLDYLATFAPAPPAPAFQQNFGNFDPTNSNTLSFASLNGLASNQLFQIRDLTNGQLAVVNPLNPLLNGEQFIRLGPVDLDPGAGTLIRNVTFSLTSFSLETFQFEPFPVGVNLILGSGFFTTWDNGVPTIAGEAVLTTQFFTIPGIPNQFSYSATIQAIPEPSSALGTMAVSLLLLRRRRRTA